jgi:hypothetical protein
VKVYLVTTWDTTEGAYDNEEDALRAIDRIGRGCGASYTETDLESSDGEDEDWRLP